MPNTKYASSSVVISSSSPIVTIVNNQATCLSTDVAQFFGKIHRNVVRDIEDLCSKLPPSRLLNFEQSEISVPSNLNNAPARIIKAYRMTRDGFTLLVMGWTGVKALQFKLAWLDAFNKMEALIREGNTAAAKAAEKPLGYKFTSVAKLRKDVQAARMALGLKCEEVGQQVGISLSSVSDFLRRPSRVPSHTNIDKYIHWLDATNALEGYYFVSLKKFRSDLQANKDSAGLSLAELARLTGICTSGLGDFLTGRQAGLCPASVSKLIAWLNSFDQTRHAQLELPEITESKVEPELNNTEVTPKSENGFDPFTAWPDYQSYFLANKAKLSPEVKNAVRTLNSYFFDKALE